jgi:hypothetical protein
VNVRRAPVGLAAGLDWLSISRRREAMGEEFSVGPARLGHRLRAGGACARRSHGRFKRSAWAR